MQRQIIVASLLAAAAATPAFAAKDNFNRTELGSDWAASAGSVYITNKAFTGDSLSLGTFNLAKRHNQASVLVKLTGTDLQYGAITIGDAATGNNAFFKVQSQNGAGTFDYGAFYTGNNGGGTFFPLIDLPAASTARLTVRLVGTVATMEIDTNLDGTPEQTYTHDYGVVYGKGVGLGTYGLIRLDNLRTTRALAHTAASAATVAPAGSHVDLSR